MGQIFDVKQRKIIVQGFFFELKKKQKKKKTNKQTNKNKNQKR